MPRLMVSSVTITSCFAIVIKRNTVFELLTIKRGMSEFHFILDLVPVGTNITEIDSETSIAFIGIVHSGRSGQRRLVPR